MEDRKNVSLSKMVVFVIITIIGVIAAPFVFKMLLAGGQAIVTPALFTAGIVFLVWYKKIPKKYRITGIVLLVALFIVLHIEIYPEVTGTVKDAGTGQGIESAIIAATYYKEMETIAGAVGQKMGVRYAVTDDNGAYRLTRYWSFSFFDFVDPEVKITALHPLYEKDDVFIRRESLPRYRDDRSVLWQVFIRKKWEFIKGAWFIDNKDKNEFGGVFDFFIRSLEEKYILEEQGNKEEVRRFDTIGIDYFKLGIKLKISKKAMARIFKKDEELFLKYKSNKEDFKYENKYFNNYKKKVMDTIGEL